MIKRISLLVSVALMTAMIMVATAAPGFAQSPSQRECEAQGGTFTRTGGEVQCVIVTEEEGKNPKFTEETTTTTTGQGNISNKQEQDTECGGTGSGKCPPGQF